MIEKPYTIAEIKAKVASNDYSAELMLQHAMLHLDALAAQPAAEPTTPKITVDFRQATELLELFGGEPADITLMTGNGHSGPGLYAVFNADPDGAVYLGEADEEATPVAAQPARAGGDAPSYDKKALNGLLNDFAQACAFGTDDTRRMRAAKNIHDWMDSALAAAPQPAPAEYTSAQANACSEHLQELREWLEGRNVLSRGSAKDLEAIVVRAFDGGLEAGSVVAQVQPAGGAVPAGFKLVPVEPTDAMLDATYAGQPCSDVWHDMLNAAPAAPAAVERDADMAKYLQRGQQMRDVPAKPATLHDVVTEAEIASAREHIADVHNGEQMRSALAQLRHAVVVELAARGLVPSFYGIGSSKEGGDAV